MILSYMFYYSIDHVNIDYIVMLIMCCFTSLATVKNLASFVNNLFILQSPHSIL